MGFIEIFGLCVTVLSLYGIVICFRFLLPSCIVPNVSTLLNDAGKCLDIAEETGAIPAESEYRAKLETLTSDLARMRIESHRSPGVLQQIWLAFGCGLTYRLYSLASQIRAVKMRVEIVMDEHRLSLLATLQNVVIEPVPRPPGDIVISMANRIPPPIVPVN